MNKKQIIELIKNEEEYLYFEFTELREMYGREHESTTYAAAQWNAISNLLELIENAES